VASPRWHPQPLPPPQSIGDNAKAPFHNARLRHAAANPTNGHSRLPKMTRRDLGVALVLKPELTSGKITDRLGRLQTESATDSGLDTAHLNEVEAPEPAAKPRLGHGVQVGAVDV
jgi:hypothetical protein